MQIIFTKHARQRIAKRKLSEEEIRDAIRYPENVRKRYGEYFFEKQLQRGRIEVCCKRGESYIKIITVYWL